VAGAAAARLALRPVLVLGAIVEYPNSECWFEQRLATRDHAHGVHDIENSRSGPSSSMV
jgi:hypothetical protein